MKLFKLSKVVFMAIMIVAMTAPAAFAGSIRWTSPGAGANVAVTVALEAMGAARNYAYSNQSTTTNTTAGGVTIFPGQALASGSVLTVSFTNAGFDGTRVLLCTNNTATAFNDTAIAAATPSANTTSQGFVMGSGLAASQNLFILTDNGSSSCNNANTALIVRFQPVTSAAMAKISYTVALSGSTYDSADAVNIANISTAISTAFGSNNSSIDFLNAPANGTTFVGNSTAAIGGNANITLTAMNLNAVTGGVVNAGLTSSAILTLQDTASWQAVRRVYLINGIASGCALANNSAINNAPSGTVPLSIPATIYAGNVAAANNVAVCADVLGNTTINPRTITGALNVSFSGTGAQSPAVTSYNSLMIWTSNGYQGVVPYISADSTYKTICLINNTGTSSAAITVDVQSSESSATLTSLQAVSLGTVSAASTKRVDFANTVTPYSYASSTETAGTATTLTGLQSNDRYSARINVAAPPASVTVNCMQVDPAGSKRALPVLTGGTTSSYLVQ